MPFTTYHSIPKITCALARNFRYKQHISFCNQANYDGTFLCIIFLASFRYNVSKTWSLREGSFAYNELLSGLLVTVLNSLNIQTSDNRSLNMLTGMREN